jgi:hypothetical protein
MIKSRRIIFTVEVESNESVKELKDNIKYTLNCDCSADEMFTGKIVVTKVLQIGVDVVQKNK